MNWRYTVGLLVVAVAVVALAYSQRSVEPVDLGVGTPTATPSPLFTMAADDVQEVSVVGATGGYTLTRVAGGWEVDDQPASDDVDDVVVGLAEASVVRDVRPGAKPEDYGFATPALTVTLKSAAGEKQVLHVGDEVPTEFGSVYVRVDDGERIAWISDVNTSRLADWLDAHPLAPTPTPTAGTPTATVEGTGTPGAEENGTPEAEATSTPGAGAVLPAALDTVLPPGKPSD